MGLGTIVFGSLSLAGVFFVGRLLLRGLTSGRMVSFHYTGHVAEWSENRTGYVFIVLYNLFWFALGAALLSATVLGRFN